MSNPSDTDLIPVADEEVVLRRSILALTESPDAASGFTIGMSLASFATNDDGGMSVPITDVVILALINILRETPDVFKQEMDKINTAISELSAAMAIGEGVEEALAKFQVQTGVAGLVRT
jgi:hypothetical protein